MARYASIALVFLAVLQVVLVTAVPARIVKRIAPVHTSAETVEGLSLLVDRIADSSYGLIDPIEPPPPPPPKPQLKPAEPFVIMANYEPDPERPPVNLAPEDMRKVIQVESANQGVDPRLIESIVRNESNFDPQARSPVGAMGLMQLMPDTAASLGVRNPYDPIQNLNGGIRYFGQQMRHFGGDVVLAVAAYNAGPHAVERYGGIPPYSETLNYVDHVIGDYQAAVR